MKHLLQERYGQSIVFAEIGGRKNVVCFRNLCNLIVNDKWHSDRDVDESTQREKIVKDAALLITSEIREMSCSMDVYPTTDDISGINQELIPPLLKLFVESLTKSKFKQSSLAQALIQAARPQSAIMPLMFGLGSNWIMSLFLSFHILMNFLGAIGYVMKGSGIEQLLGLLYGPSTVDHVMSGKAFARALRGHCIVHDCLVQLLLQYVVGNESQRNNSVVQFGVEEQSRCV